MLHYKKIKIFLASMILIALSSGSCLTAGGAFAAENDDVYVRKDLFEAYMKNIDSKLDTILKEQSLMREEQKSMREEQKNIDTRLTKLEARVEGVFVALSNRIEGISVALSNNFNGLEKRFDVLLYVVIAFIGLIGVIFGLPVVQRLWEQRKDTKRIEDIEKIFERMFEAKLTEMKMKGNLSNAAI